MQHYSLFLALTLLLPALKTRAQECLPSIGPVAIFTTSDGEDEETSYSGSAPLVARFEARPSDCEGWTTYYEWRFTKNGSDTPYLIRYEQNTEYTFRDAGTHVIELYAIFTQGKDSVVYTEEYWADADPIQVTISESKLDMPNAFSPNDDGYNDVYKAKSGYQSIVEFQAIIFNRWGQKLFEWTDPADGWDGTFKGKPVKDGVYFVQVKAKGADGRVYHIRRDVNLLRGYQENNGTSSGTNE